MRHMPQVAVLTFFTVDKPINVQPSSAGLLPQKSINKELNVTTQQEIKVASDNLLVCRLVSFPPLVDMALAKSGKCFLSLIFRLKIELIFQSENLSCDQPDHQMDAV